MIEIQYPSNTLLIDLYTGNLSSECGHLGTIEDLKTLQSLVKQYLPTNGVHVFYDEDHLKFIYKNGKPNPLTVFNFFGNKDPVPLIDYVKEIYRASKPTEFKKNIGDIFNLNLTECGACGYSWEITYDKDKLDMIGSNEECPPPPAVGGACKKKLTFKVIKRGCAKIIGYYYRPWEPKGFPSSWIINVP